MFIGIDTINDLSTSFRYLIVFDDKFINLAAISNYFFRVSYGFGFEIIIFSPNFQICYIID
ncbi:MAG: hypothetical protein KGD73_02680 [Candidatus Lokiarchaeota archaeon]|nr:hypothetical protein [Candidatus Lokiarchaeota archaeon]